MAAEAKQRRDIGRRVAVHDSRFVEAAELGEDLVGARPGKQRLLVDALGDELGRRPTSGGPSGRAVGDRRTGA